MSSAKPTGSRRRHRVGLDQLGRKPIGLGTVFGRQLQPNFDQDDVPAADMRTTPRNPVRMVESTVLVGTLTLDVTSLIGNARRRASCEQEPRMTFARRNPLQALVG